MASMIKILFVCHGNICRSPMAEFVMKELVKKAGKESDFLIESAATSNEEIGNDNLFVGYSDNYLKVVFLGSEDMIGELVRVKITKAGYPYNEGQFVKVMNPQDQTLLEA